MWQCQYGETWNTKQTPSVICHIVVLYEWLISVTPNRNVYCAARSSAAYWVMPITSYSKLDLHKELRKNFVRLDLEKTENSCATAETEAMQIKLAVVDTWLAWSVCPSRVFKATVHSSCWVALLFTLCSLCHFSSSNAAVVECVILTNVTLHFTICWFIFLLPSITNTLSRGPPLSLSTSNNYFYISPRSWLHSILLSQTVASSSYRNDPLSFFEGQSTEKQNAVRWNASNSGFFQIAVLALKL